MQFLILRQLQKSELGWFAEFRRSGEETSRQRAINFDAIVVDRVFPLSRKADVITLSLRHRGDGELLKDRTQFLRRQQKNWRMTGDKVDDKRYGFVHPGDLFVLSANVGRTNVEGAFDVLPADSQTCLQLLSIPETSELLKNGMIALDKGEAGRAFRILAEHDMELFPMDDSAPMTPKRSEREEVDRVLSHERPPNPARTMQIFANIGHSLKVAVADLVDNSIAAGATEVKIFFPEPDGVGGRHLVIADNGRGMDKNTLLEAMTIGSEREYESFELGKFGVGMKAASFSQARVLTVSSKSRESDVEVFRWDRNLVQQTNTWNLVQPELENWEAEYLLDQLGDKKSGTAVLWSEMNSPLAVRRARGSSDATPFGRELEELAIHLEMVFHRFLEGEARGYPKLTILLNKNKLTPWDPFLTSHDKTLSLDGFSVPLMSEEGKEFHVSVKPYVLPAKTDLSDEQHQRAGHRNQWNKMQGLYVYRGDRLIHAGDWCGIWQLDEHMKLSRVAVEFDPALDEAFDINVAKMEVKLPTALGAELKTRLKAARKQARNVYDNATKTSNSRRGAARPSGRSSGGTASSGEGREAATSQNSSVDSSGQPRPATGLISGSHFLELKNMDGSRLWLSRKDLAGSEIVALNSNIAFARKLYESLRGNSEGQRLFSMLLGVIDKSVDDPREVQNNLYDEISKSKD
ncbi:MAG: ATP-binding protein [Chromatiaceae bacterium]|nr:ATP-binding protein [Chromatiaceae bacterium]HPE79765.1 ATP-binding protein [Gammaproteobacteria bacterium]